MITFKQFLAEEKTTADIIQSIPELCAKFISESGGLPLFRGFGTKEQAKATGAKEETIRQDRRPKDSSNESHDLMDLYFQKKLGKKIRSASLFCSGSQAAGGYGFLHYVLPVGDYSYLWGSIKGEPISDTLTLSKEIDNQLLDNESNDLTREEIINQVMDKVDWHQDNLKEAIKGGSKPGHFVEIAIMGHKAILVPIPNRGYGSSFHTAMYYRKLITGKFNEKELRAHNLYRPIKD